MTKHNSKIISDVLIKDRWPAITRYLYLRNNAEKVTDNAGLYHYAGNNVEYNLFYENSNDKNLINVENNEEYAFVLSNLPKKITDIVVTGGCGSKDGKKLGKIHDNPYMGSDELQSNFYSIGEFE